MSDALSVGDYIKWVHRSRVYISKVVRIGHHPNYYSLMRHRASSEQIADFDKQYGGEWAKVTDAIQGPVWLPVGDLTLATQDEVMMYLLSD
jgi:hypothetical protein